MFIAQTAASKALIPSRLKAADSHLKPCQEDFTIMIVFPNFSQQPIFAKSGKSVELKAMLPTLRKWR